MRKYFDNKCKNKFWHAIKPFATNKLKSSDDVRSLKVSDSIEIDPFIVCKLYLTNILITLL